MNKTILECNGIAAGYVKGLNILQGVDLVVHESEIVSIIGPNGAGKSTLLKAIMGLIKVSAGRFYINGIEKTNLSTHKIVTEGIGYVPQVANVFPSLTIEENLEIGAWSLNNKKESIKNIYTNFVKIIKIHLNIYTKTSYLYLKKLKKLLKKFIMQAKLLLIQK